MIKALQFLSDKNSSYSNNYLLVGDNDFLYLFIKNQIVKNSQKKDETFVFDCADKSILRSIDECAWISRFIFKR